MRGGVGGVGGAYASLSGILLVELAAAAHCQLLMPLYGRVCVCGGGGLSEMKAIANCFQISTINEVET